MTDFFLMRHTSGDPLERCQGGALRAAVAHYVGLSLHLLHRFWIAPISLTVLRVAEHATGQAA
jgi:broad specificity phosphatase PhoE